MKERLLFLGALLLYCTIGTIVAGIFTRVFSTVDYSEADAFIITICWPITLICLVFIALLNKIARFTFLIVRKIKKTLKS